MRLNAILFVLLFIFSGLPIFAPSISIADCRGCCSGHGGVDCIDGVTRCKDGTDLSDRCREKCNKCGTTSAQAQRSNESNTIKNNSWNDSFNRAKRTLQRHVYADHKITFYCGCTFNDKKKVRPCDKYKPKNDSRRAKRIEWEHIVPAAHFGQSFKAWRNGHPDCVDKRGKPFKGRGCAGKVSQAYRYMESDMYNLVPAIGEVNGLRSNFRFDMIAGEKRDFGACDMEIDSTARIAEPPERVRGDIARTYKYMDEAYPGHGIIGEASKKLFDAWDKLDPVDAWECERCRRIESIQKNENSIVKNACQTDGLW